VSDPIGQSDHLRVADRVEVGPRGLAQGVHVAGRGWWSVGVLGVALAAMLMIYRPLWADPTHQTLGSANHTNDPLQTMWNLKWVAWQLLHGHDPFRTRAIYYPGGVSLSWNTLMPTLGILVAPVTLTAGAVFAFALLMTVAPALASLTGFWWLRRHTRRSSAAALGGLVVGFNPYMSGHLLGHLDLTFVALVPVMLMLVEDLLWRRPRPARRTALYLGLVTAAQAGINEELILITAIGALLALLSAALVYPSMVSSAARTSWQGFTLAAAVFLFAASPILVDQLFLSPHVPLRASAWRANLGDYLLPLHRQLVDPQWPHFTGLGGAEDGVYLGPVLIAVLIVGIAVSVAHDRTVRIAALALAALVLLTFGDTGGGLPLPWRLFSGLPVLTSILPGRFSFASWLLIAWLVSRWVDRLMDHSATVSHSSVVARRLALVAIGLSLVTIAPSEVGAAPTPMRIAFFSSRQAQSLLASGARVLLLPVPTWSDASGMFYQQQADFRFNQPGGYALRPAPNHNVAYGPPDSALVRLSATYRSLSGRSAVPAEIIAGRRQLTTQKYQAIIVVAGSPYVTRLIELAEQLTRRDPDLHVGGVWLWNLRPPTSTPPRARTPPHPTPNTHTQTQRT
jgi:hypothetical protein